MSPISYFSYVAACREIGLQPPRITQTIGNAEASKGTHAQDGMVWVKDEWEPYCAAFDISIENFKRTTTIRRYLEVCARHYIIGWYRHTGSFESNRHCHMIDVRLKMKPALAAQVRDYLNDRTGLVGHGIETFYTAPKKVDDLLRAAFLVQND
jgi:hypothetical protein